MQKRLNHRENISNRIEVKSRAYNFGGERDYVESMLKIHYFTLFDDQR